MPDLLLVFTKRWKFILSFVAVATIAALLFSLISPKKYLSVATALPANSVTADKARIFNPNIEGLYSEFGSPDELDRLEGTAALDTIFIAASRELNLPKHYSIATKNEDFYKAAMELKASTKINRSSYGELKVKVWDKDRNRAAQLANFLIQKLSELHQHLQNQNNISVLEKIKQEYASKQNEYQQLAGSVKDTSIAKEIIKTKLSALADELQQYEKIIGQYQLAVSTDLPVLLIVENARPALRPDKPRIVSTVLFTFFAALIFSFLLAFFIESKKTLV